MAKTTAKTKFDEVAEKYTAEHAPKKSLSTERQKAVAENFDKIVTLQEKGYALDQIEEILLEAYGVKYGKGTLQKYLLAEKTKRGISDNVKNNAKVGRPKKKELSADIPPLPKFSFDKDKDAENGEQGTETGETSPLSGETA